MAYGYQRREKARARREVDHWRQTRLLATILLNAHRGEHDAAQAPEDLFELPGDAKRELPVALTTEEIEDGFTRAGALDADLL